jgi:hypothetical protein
MGRRQQLPEVPPVTHTHTHTHKSDDFIHLVAAVLASAQILSLFECAVRFEVSHVRAIILYQFKID